MADRRRKKTNIEEFDDDFEVETLMQEESEEAPSAETDLQLAGEEALEPAEEARYFIDQQWYDDHGLSFSSVAQARLCASCSAKIGTFTEERFPTIDPKTKRVTFEYRKVPFATNPLPIIRDCCSRSRDYITPETPLLEALFRVFLANGNQPMTSSTLREHLLTYIPEMSALALRLSGRVDRAHAPQRQDLWDARAGTADSRLIERSWSGQTGRWPRGIRGHLPVCPGSRASLQVQGLEVRPEFAPQILSRQGYIHRCLEELQLVPRVVAPALKR